MTDPQEPGRRRPAASIAVRRNSDAVAALLVVWAWSGACAQDAARTVTASEQAIVYGNDDRVDLYAAPERYAQLARQTAIALLGPSQLHAHADTGYSIEAPAYGEAQMLCAGERFADQPAAASCSGLLIAPDIVLTAAHCLGLAPNGDPDCTNNRYVRGFSMSAPAAPIAIEATDVFDCKRVLARVRTPDDSECHFDFALLELTQRVSAEFAPLREQAVEAGEPLVVVGFPAGLPLKVDTGASVVDARSERGDFFTLSSDTFSVSSGSGVYSEGELVGLFSRGRRDYDTEDSCQRVHHEDEASAPAYEQATQIAAVRRVLNAVTHHEATEPAASCDVMKFAELEPGKIAQARDASTGCTVACVGTREPQACALLSALLVALLARRRLSHRSALSGPAQRIARRRLLERAEVGTAMRTFVRCHEVVRGHDVGSSITRRSNALLPPRFAPRRRPPFA